jgi:hypothetical protein
MSWIKNAIKNSVITSILDAILKSNPQLYAAIDLLNEIPILQILLHYQEERKKLNLPPGKPVNWMSYAEKATRFPITVVLVELLQKEYGITNVSDMNVQELVDSFTKIGSDKK